VTTVLTDLVTEFESLDFANAADRLTILIRAARGGTRGRNDLLRIVVSRLIVRAVLDDVLREAMRSLLRGLLPDVAANPSQIVLSGDDSPRASLAVLLNAPRREERLMYSLLQGGPLLKKRRLSRSESASIRSVELRVP
jgi:hypothetical protein